MRRSTTEKGQETIGFIHTKNDNKGKEVERRWYKRANVSQTIERTHQEGERKGRSSE